MAMKRGMKRKNENSFNSYSLANKKINMAARVIQVKNLMFTEVLSQKFTIYCAVKKDKIE